MEKKYYLRGLGLGIIVTAVIMGIALSGGAAGREMTDEEVIARARELGMTENTRLLEPTEENQEEETPAEAKEPVKKDVAVKAEAEVQKKDAETAAKAEARKKDSETAAEAETQKKDEKAEAETETKPSADTPEPKKDTNEMTKQDDDGSMKPSGTETDSSTKPTGTETDSDTKPVSGGTKSVTIISGDSSYTIAKKLEAAGVVDSASSYDTYLCEHGYDKKLRTGTFQIPEGATEEQIAKIVTGQ